MAIAPSAIDSLDVLGNDRCLVEAHRAGNAHAFAEIVRLHYPTLLAVARRRLGTQADAEDAVQETLLRAFRALDRFGDHGDWRLGAWLNRILLNVCLDAGARRQQSDRLEVRLEGVAVADERDVADLASDPVALAAVQQALDSLPATQQRAFVLRVVDDLPYPEVAEQLGISEDNARARVQRARAALRHVLVDSKALAGTLAAVPLVGAASLRSALRRLVRGGVPTPVVGRPAADSLRLVPGSTSAIGSVASSSLASPSVSGPVSSMAGPVSSMAGSVSPAAGTLSSTLSEPLSAGSQLVGQLAATPVGQMALAASSSVGPAKGSIVLGLAASLATAGALAMPGGSSSAPSTGSGRVAAMRTVNPEGGASTGTDGAAAAAAPGTGSTTAAAASGTAPAAAPAAAAATTGTTTTPATPATPAWVKLAAAGTLAAATQDTSTTTGTTGTGTSSTGTTGTGTTGTADPGTATAGTSAAAGTGTSASGTAGTATAPSATATGSSSGTAGAGASGTGSATSGAAATSLLPPGTCTTVPGFSGVTTPATPPLTSYALEDMLDTGAVTLPAGGASTTGPAAGVPTFDSTATLGASNGSGGLPVTITTGACFGQGGSVLVADIAGADGTTVQLVGSLVSEPVATADDGGAGSGQDTSYLFRGSATQIGGVFQESGALPWGLPSSFVAELQVVQPANSAELTIAFVDPTATDATTGGVTTGTTDPGTATAGDQGTTTGADSSGSSAGAPTDTTTDTADPDGGGAGGTTAASPAG